MMKKVYCLILLLFCLVLCNCDGRIIDNGDENSNTPTETKLSYDDAFFSTKYCNTKVGRELFEIEKLGDYWIDKITSNESQNNDIQFITLGVYIYDESNHPKIGIDYCTDIIYECYFEDGIYKWRENGIKVDYNLIIINLVDDKWQLFMSDYEGKIDNITTKVLSVIKTPVMVNPLICVDISNGDIYTSYDLKNYEKVDNVIWYNDDE